MQEETVKTKDGNEKRVIVPAGGTKADLDAAVKAAKEDQAPVYPNINQPVPKGHDLVEVDEGMNVETVDGTGAHNSPWNAIRQDGSEEGDPDVPVTPEEEPATVRVGESHEDALKREAKSSSSSSKSSK